MVRRTSGDAHVHHMNTDPVVHFVSAVQDSFNGSWRRMVRSRTRTPAARERRERTPHLQFC